MKILMLADTMDIGGAETHVYELSRSLSSMGHRIKILSGGGKTARLFANTLVDFEETDSLKALYIHPQRATKRLLAVLRDFKPDVVHAHTRKTLFIANAAKKIIPFALVYTAHAKFSASPIKRLFTNPPPQTIAVSEDIKSHFTSVFGAKSITVIENGIDVARFSPPKKRPEKLRVLNVSRLDRDSSKTAELLCLIAPKLCRIYPEAEIEIVGGGNDFSRISALADSANKAIGKLTVSCAGAQTDILPFLHKANLFVGVSRAALEAMSTGLPAIICGNEGYSGICRNSEFDTCAEENFCARNGEEATADRLFLDILKLFEAPPLGSDTLREKVIKKYDSTVSAKKTAQIYATARKDFKRSQKHGAVICGYYGFGNLGDEMVLESIKKELSNAKIAVIGARGGGRIGRLRFFRAARAIRSSELFILGGGSLLQNSTSRRSLEYYLALLRTADFFGRKTLLLANGLGPIYGESALKRCKKALSHLDAASFRDTVSLNAAKPLLATSTKRILTCDPVLCQYPTASVENRIAFFIRGEDAKIIQPSLLASALSKFKREKSPSLSVVFCSINKKKDGTAAQRLASSIPFSEYKNFDNSQELFEYVASSEAVISSRLHALIVAASTARPFVALCGDPKLEAFMKEFGLPKILMPPIDCENLSQKICDALCYISSHREEITNRIKNALPHLINRSKQDTEILKLLLE